MVPASDPPANSYTATSASLKPHNRKVVRERVQGIPLSINVAPFTIARFR
jgi:hypothetical protein